jgi:DHA2 family multidrug resistance protein
MLPNFVQGIAMAFFFAPLVSISLGGIEPGRLAAAAGMQNFIRNLLGSFGTSLSITFWDRHEALHRTFLASRMTDVAAPTTDYLARLDAAGVPAAQAHAMIDRLLIQQSYTLSANDLYWVTSSIMLSIIVLVWFARPPFAHAAAPADPD